MRRAKSSAYMRLSGLISMVEPGWDLSARYRSEISGSTREDGVDALARVNLNSASPSWFSSTAFEFNVTMSSRHWGVLDAFCDCCSFVGPVGVMISCGWFSGAGGIDSKAWIGSASKNSWAIMNGVRSSSAACQRRPTAAG